MNVGAEQVLVHLDDRSYQIAIGHGILGTAGRFLVDCCGTSHAVVVTDQNVERHHGRPIVESLRQHVSRVDMLAVPAGEPSKSVACATSLWQQLLELGGDRNSVIVAAGGGVVGDLAGFVAATFARGIRFLQIPTTLLAQVDSSVGGKVGINLPAAKNIVGAFWQPLGVLIDTDVLETLPDRHYRAGLAEVVKYGVILDAQFFGYLEGHVTGLIDRDAGVLRHVIARCCRLKADVVQEDEREESGLRAILNYGHTFCHALEAATGYGELLHGEAVAIGMICASRLAERLRRVGSDVTQRQFDLLRTLGLPTLVPDVSHDALIQLMSHDKKADRGQLRFVLPTKLGHVELVGDVQLTDVRSSLEGDAS